MTKVTDIYQSEFLRVGDLQKPVRVVIQDWTTQEFTDQKTNKPQPRIVLQFVNAKKRLILSPTNAHAIGNAYGDLEAWPGRALIIAPGVSRGQPTIVATPIPLEAAAESAPPSAQETDNPFL